MLSLRQTQLQDQATVLIAFAQTYNFFCGIFSHFSIKYILYMYICVNKVFITIIYTYICIYAYVTTYMCIVTTIRFKTI